MRKQSLPKLQAALDTLAGKKSMVLYSILAVILLCLFVNVGSVHAAESSIKVTQNGILNGNLDYCSKLKTA